MGPKDQNQLTRLGGNHLHPLSHLTSSAFPCVLPNPWLLAHLTGLQSSHIDLLGSCHCSVSRLKAFGVHHLLLCPHLLPLSSYSSTPFFSTKPIHSLGPVHLSLPIRSYIPFLPPPSSLYSKSSLLKALLNCLACKYFTSLFASHDMLFTGLLAPSILYFGLITACLLTRMGTPCGQDHLWEHQWEKSTATTAS